MDLSCAIRGVRYRFDSVKELLGRANPPKSGDDLAGVSARSAVERVAARAVLAGLTLAELRQHPVIPYEADELTRAVEDDLDEEASRRRRRRSRRRSPPRRSGPPSWRRCSSG